MSCPEKLSAEDVRGVAEQLPGYVEGTDVYVLFTGWVKGGEGDDYRTIELQGPEEEGLVKTYSSKK